MKFIISIFFLVTITAKASIPITVPLEQVVLYTDHILTTQVVSVDMVNSGGEQITDLGAMTGPGTKNTIRLKLKVLKVHETSSKKVPRTLFVPLDSNMHFSLGQIKKSHENDNTKYLVLLEGENFQPSYSGVFKRNINDLKEVLHIKNDLNKAGVIRPKEKIKPEKFRILNYQKKLKSEGYYHGVVNGILNTETREALKKFMNDKESK